MFFLRICKFALSKILLCLSLIPYIILSLSYHKSSKDNKILICRNKFRNQKKTLPSPESEYIDYWINKLNINYDTFIFDKCYDYSIQYKLIIKIIFYKPNLIIFSSFKTKSKYYPSSLLLKVIKYISKTKIIFLWWDSCSNTFADGIKKYVDKKYFELHGIMDDPIRNLDLSNINNNEKKTFYFECFSPEMIERYIPNEDKYYDVVFLGQTDSYRDYRNEYIKFLQSNLKDLNCFFSTKNIEFQLSDEDHDKILSRAKIGLNFSFSVDYHQLKGRTFYTMLSGAMLLETDNYQTKKIFKEGEDFISFYSKEDMLDKIKFYLKHYDARKKIAESGRKKYIQKYNGLILWSDLLKKIQIL